jgi:hypothetical protein
MFSIDPRGGHNRYKFKTDFFEKWSPEMAYVLGFTFADGNITDAKSSRAQYFHVDSKDKNIIEKIKIILGANHPIYINASHFSEHKNGRYKSKDLFRLRIGSKKLFNDLLQLGLTPNKSKTVRFPANIPEEFLGDFVRGYFDGDGCVYFQKGRGITKPIIIKKLSVIFTSGSYNFLEELSKILKSRLLLRHDKIYRGSGAFQIRYSTADSLKIFSLIYKDCNNGLYLERKFDIFREYFQMAPQKIDHEMTGILNN